MTRPQTLTSNRFSSSLAQALTFLILSFLALGSNAQFDTEFWMPPIWDSGQSAHNQPSELFITTPDPGIVNVHIETADGTTFVFDGTVSSGNPLQVVLTPTIAQTTTPNTVSTNAGLIITSDSPIQCVHKISGQFNQTLVTLKGRNGLGQDFWCGSQVRNMNANYSPNEYHFISVMAMENNTTITFTTPFGMYTAAPGDLPNPYTITLNQYESYLIRGNNPIQHVAGAHVTSDKEIVVISGSTHTRIAGGNAADGGTDQLVPVDLMGTGFVLVKGDNNDPFDYGIIVATENSTEVYLDGNPTPVATINAGQFYDFTLPGGFGSGHYVATNKTAYCYHFTGASQDDEVGMSAIPQLECTGSRYIEFSKFTVNTINQVMNVIAPPEAESSLELNGVPYDQVPGAIFGPIPGLTDWVAVAFPQNSLADNNILTSDGFFHAGYLTGNGGATGTYGFLSGFDDAFEFLNPYTGIPTTIYLLDTLCQGETIDHCLQVFSCADDHNIIDVQGNEGTVVVTPPTEPYDTCFSYTAPFNFTGLDTITFTVDNRFGFSGSVDIVMLVVDPDTPINAGPSQQLCSPVSSATLSAVSPDPLVDGFWTVLQGGSTISNPNSPTTPVTNLALGVNTFLWTQDYGCETNTAITQITVYDGAAPNANAGPDVQLCSNTTTYVMQANNPGVSATGTWEIVQGNATINNINNASATVSNLGIGVNIFEWNLDNGPCPGGATVDQMIITVYNQNQAAANAGPDQQFCASGFTSATMAGNQAVFPATGQWSVVSGSGTFANPNIRNTTVTGLSFGQNVFQWTINNGPCGTTTDTVVITLFNPNTPAANAGPDAAYCTPTTTHVMAATPATAPATGTWTLVSGAGTIANTSNPTTTVSNLGVGVNTFRWTINNGPCGNSNFDEVSITIYSAAATVANAGPDQIFCDQGFTSAQLAANSVSFPANGTWSVVSGSGTFSNANSATSTVSGLSLGANVFQWTVNNGPCGTATDTVTITLYDDIVPVPNAGPDAEYCSPTSTHTMAATPVSFPVSGAWTLVAGSGNITNPSSATTTVTGLAIGDNTFRWTVNNTVCAGVSSFDEVTITIYNGSLPAANAGPDQSFCNSTFTSATLAGSAATYPASGTWTVVSGTGTFSNANSPSSSVTGLSLGANVFQWSVDNGPCNGVTTDTVTITLFDDSQAAANAGPDASFCTPTSTYTMQATPVVLPATGTWTLVQGTGTINNPSSPTTSVSGLGIGVNIFRWTVNNGPCAGGNFDEVSIFIFDENQPAANAGPDQEFCFNPVIPIIVNLSANAAIPPGTGQWTLVQGTGNIASPNSPTTTVNGLSIGENIFQWTISNGPCVPSTTSDQVSIFIFDPSMPVANAGPDQSICSDQTSVALNALDPIFPASGQWLVTQGSGVFADATDPNTTVSGLSIGYNTLRWTVSNGPCGTPTFDEVTIVVFDITAPDANAGFDQEICSNQLSVILDGSASVFPGVGTWSVIQGSGVFANVNDEITTVTGLSLGENIFLWTIDNGPCPSGITTDTVSIFVYDEDAPAANAGPDQQLCTPQTSTQLAGNTPIFPATGQWSVISGTGTFADASDPNTTVTGLGIGQNVFRWTLDNSPCIPELTFDQVVVTVFDGTLAGANAGADQSFCTPISSTQLNATPVALPATGSWTLVGGTGTIVNPSSPTSTVNGLSVGANTFRWTVSNGPCGAPTFDEVTIFIFDENQELASTGPDQVLCSPTSFTTITGNSLIFPATGQWTVVSGTGSITNPSSPSTTVTGLSIGVHVFRWTVFNGPCSPATSFDDITITIYDDNAPDANAGPDQSICTPTTSVTMAANSAIFPGTGAWTLVSGSGVITTPSSPTTTITGLGVGANVFQWTINNGPCAGGTTSDQVTIFVFSSQAPNANSGPDQNLCTPQTSTTMAANSPVFPGTGAWTLISGTGTIVNPSSPTTSITGLSIGVNVFQWTISNGPCANATTSDTVTITVFDGGAPAAEAGPEQELCSPQFDTQLNADPAVPPGTGLWSVVTGTGTFADPSDPNTTVTGLSFGLNTFAWTLDYSTCGIQQDTVNIYVYDTNLPGAFAGEDQSFCAPISDTNLDADPVPFPAYGFWTLISGNGDIVDINDPATAVSNLTVGENIFVWTIYNGGCLPVELRTDTVSVFIFDNIQLPANAGPDQELCTPTTSTSLAGNSVTFPAEGTWTLVSGTGTIANPNSPTTSVSGLSVGANVFEWSIVNGNCGTTTDQVTIFVFDQNNPVANAGPDQEFCSPVSSTFLSGSVPTFPASGVWTVINGTGTFADPTDPNTEVTGLSIGQNTFRWTVDNGPCGALTNDIVNVFIFDENAADADAGSDQELCFPETSTVMTANDATFPGIGTWTILQGSGTFSNVNNAQATVSNLSIGENIFVWTISNGPCANALTSDQVSIFVFDPTNPAANAGPDQFLCTPQTSTFLEADVPVFPSTGVWTVILGTGTFADATDPNTEVTGLSVGQNTFRWTEYNGPCAQGSTVDQVSVFLFDENQPAANAGPDQNICTPQTSVTMAGNALTFPATGQWTLIQGSGTIVNPGSPTTTVNNLGVGINIFQWTISNGPCPDAVTSDTVVINVFDQQAPDANAGPDQELCLPTTTTFLDADPATGAATGTWTLVSGSGDITDPANPNTTVTNLAQGENIFEWTIDNGVCGGSSDQVSIFVFDPNAPEANAGENQEFCTPVSTTTMTATTPAVPGVGTWALVVGNGTINNVNNPSSAISGLTIGENIFSWTVYNGPCEEPTVDFVSIFIYDENAPPAYAGEDQELCLPQTSTALNATPAVFPASGSWSLVQGTGIIADINDPNTTVSGLSEGVNTFVWTTDNSPCQDPFSSDSVSILVFSDDAPEAEAGDNIELCSPASATVLGADPPSSPQSGSWQLLSGSGTISNPDQYNSIVSGLQIGVNVFQWTIYNGPCENGESSDTMAVLVYDENAPAADAGPDQELCLPDNSTVLAAVNPVIPAVGTWTLVQGTGTIVSPNNPQSPVTNLGAGVNIFEWTVDNGPCEDAITSDQMVINVFSEDAPLANAGPDQFLCTPTSTTLMAATPGEAPQFGTWALVSGSGVISDVNDPNAIISGLQVGINTFSWTIYNGPCDNAQSIDLVSIYVYDQNMPPAFAGEDQEICLPENSVTMTATAPIVPATGMWTLVSGSGVITDPTDPTTTITGLTVGENIFEWTVDNGPCEDAITSDTVSIFVYEENAPVANAGPDKEICTPENCVQLTAIPPASPNVGTWTILQGSGSIDDVNDPFATICGLTVGTTVLQWTVNNGPCDNAESIDIVEVSVYDASAPVAEAGPDQELCAPESTTVMAAEDPAIPGVGTWVLISGNGTIVNSNDPETQVIDLEIGVNVFGWSVYNGPCAPATVDTISIVVFDPNSPNASAGADQFFCTPFGGTTMEANSASPPADGTWTVISGSANITDIHDPNTNVDQLALGENILIWQIYNGACANSLTTDTVSIFVNDANVANANAGPDQFYCGVVDSLQLAGSETIGNTAIGEWTVIQGGGEFANTANEFSYVYNVPLGLNTYVWTVDNLECGISSDTVSIWVFDPELEPAYAGENLEFCEDEFMTFDLNAIDPEFPAYGYWSIIEGPIEISDSLDANAEVLSLGSIGVPLTSTISVLSWTVDNGVCGTSVDTVMFVLNDCLTIDIPDAFSPNGDNINDTWVIPNLESYPNNSVKIFNRWGALIYEATPYNNDWDGRSDHPSTIGENLPVSTYYYILDLGDGSQPFSGYVYLKR